MELVSEAQTPAAQVAAHGFAAVQANVIAGLVGATILVMEFFNTIEDEVELLWPSDWSLAKVLFFANRVSPFIIVPLTPIYNLIPNPEPQTCQIIFGVLLLGVSTSIIIAEGLLYLRLYALAGRTRWARLALTSNILFSALLAIIVQVYYIASGTWGKDIISGCHTISASSLFILIGFATLVYNGLMGMVLSIYFGVKAYWAAKRSPLFQVFYLDGTFYFIVLAVMSAGNGIAALLLPAGYRYLMGPFQAIMHSTLSARMVLRLRAQAKRGMGYNVFGGTKSLGPVNLREDAYPLESTNSAQKGYPGTSSSAW